MHFGTDKLGLRLADDDATYLASRGLKDIRLAMGVERSLTHALQLLRAKSEEEEGAKPFRVEPGQIELSDLSGYGEARAWGLQLAEDTRKPIFRYYMPTADLGEFVHFTRISEGWTGGRSKSSPGTHGVQLGRPGGLRSLRTTLLMLCRPLSNSVRRNGFA